MGLIIGLTLIFSYGVSIVSAIMVLPFIWLVIGVILAVLGGSWLFVYKYNHKSVPAIAIFTNGVFTALGQYLESVFPASSILINTLGMVLTIFMMLLWYYWKEGQRHVEVRVKKEKVIDEPAEANSIFERLRFLLSLRKRQKQLMKEKQYPSVLAFQFAYVEHKENEMKKEEKNALDFILGQEVELKRNEYDQSPID
ncbi:hypothetical protein [Bacillus sp. 1P06AnD]|uniref:hypothetical protein n=1 Tax=Bacillus sp. 1P06AnD TaxID=3132208 RepID=UPI0039A29860